MALEPPSCRNDGRDGRTYDQGRTAFAVSLNVNEFRDAIGESLGRFDSMRRVFEGNIRIWS